MPGATTIAVGDPKAVKRWSASLFVESSKKSYWDRKFVGESDNHCIQRLTELENEAGDTISFDLALLLTGEPVYGDARAEGKERNLKFATDTISIDQMFYPVNAGGVMTRKRTVHKLRPIARNRMSDYWARFVDEMYFIYLSGSRGINEGFNTPVTWAGIAGNPITAPDDGHLMFAGTAASKAAITANDTMSRNLIERAKTKAEMMREVNPTVSEIVPLEINGEAHYVCLMNPFQEHDLRTDTGSGGWLDIQKAAAASEGRNNPIFKGSLGMINNVVLHSHKSAIRFGDYGASSNLPAGRALFLGRQAGVVAYGSTSGMRFDWKEQLTDYKRILSIGSGTICGVKKTRFQGQDFGLFSIDTYCKDPNAA
ncbi:N4-gp56 family major capsid protein [Chelatococcus sp. XZ-Ab1]|uniref:N4-gp56 family major capsid protein n=1 Tax=Chelatococcus sp. XZ-Ab1 TaxID=3034027 RepID=UPI0023E3855A|nr:N4-gp56 family major capsid protein [Chelatococcus sp. XZ-Ab1]